MNQTITSYYLPQNLHINKGKIYTLYLNKVTNLDLSSITNKDNNIIINKEDYNKLLSILNTFTTLYTQSQELTTKISKGRTK